MRNPKIWVSTKRRNARDRVPTQKVVSGQPRGAHDRVVLSCQLGV